MFGVCLLISAFIGYVTNPIFGAFSVLSLSVLLKQSKLDI